MGFLNSIGGLLGGKASGVNNPNKNNNLNQTTNEQWMRENTLVRDPMYITPVDEDKNGVADILETKHKKYFGDEISREDKLKPFSFKKPRKDYNQSFDKKGRYVATATYPLPPVKHEKEMYERNRAINNKDNDFLLNSRLISKPEKVDNGLKRYQMQKMKQINGRLNSKPKPKFKQELRGLQDNQIKFF